MPASPAFPLLPFCLEIFQKHLFRAAPIPEYYQAAFLDLTFRPFQDSRGSEEVQCQPAPLRLISTVKMYSKFHITNLQTFITYSVQMLVLPEQ